MFVGGEMKSVCAWCGTTIGDEPGGGLNTSHGICLQCAGLLEKEVSDWGTASSVRGLLDRMDKPVMVVGEDVEILYANAAACDILGKELTQIQGFRGGDALECSNARLPGGCGRSANCKACTIRRSVNETFTTGRSIEKVQAFIDRGAGSPKDEIRFFVSTARVGGIVLLRIEDLETDPQK